MCFKLNDFTYQLKSSEWSFELATFSKEFSVEFSFSTFEFIEFDNKLRCSNNELGRKLV